MRLPRVSSERQASSALHERARGPEEACRRLQGFLPSSTATSRWSSPLRTRLVRVAMTTLHGRSSSSQAHAWTCAQRGEAERSGLFAARGTTGTAGDGDKGERIALCRMRWDAAASRASSLGNQRSKDLGGEQSPGRVGPRGPETVVEGTDPDSEKGLEGSTSRGASQRMTSVTAWFGCGVPRGQVNARKATAMATWCGRGRGESFEGYESAVRNARST